MNKTHGMYGSGEYNSWRSMKQRCFNKNSKDYKMYGGMGVSMSLEWRDSFEAFFNDLGFKPSKNHTIDRINPNKGYYPDNCRWADKTTQARNKRMIRSSTTGVNGVYLTPSKTFIARIRVNYKIINLGTYKTIEQATKARKDAELKYWS